LARYVNAGAPTEIGAALRSTALRLFVRLFAGGWGISPATHVVCLAKGLADKAKNHDNAKARERNPAFHSITTLYKCLESLREPPAQEVLRFFSDAVWAGRFAFHHSCRRGANTRKTRPWTRILQNGVNPAGSFGIKGLLRAVD
jgi:hypothetical protein